MHIWRLIIIMALLRMVLSALFPLSADEAYYWVWSRHLDLSFVDHPPMIAFINFLTTRGASNLFMLRLGANIMVSLVSLLLYLPIKKYFSRNIAYFSVLLFQLLPHFLIIWLTMFVELPLAVFWTASFGLFFIIIRSGRKDLWYLLGVMAGLGCLSKYTMFLFWPCMALFFLLAPDSRFWLRRKEPYLAFVIAALFFSPVLFWNYQHNWASFVFHGARAAGDALGSNLVPFIGDQLVHFTPFLIFLLFPVYRFALKKDGSTRLLFCFSAPVLLIFLIASVKIKVWAHWPAIGYITYLPLFIMYLSERGKSVKKYLRWPIGFTCLILAVIFFVSPAVLLNQKAYQKNYGLEQTLPSGYKIFAGSYVTAALLEFYTRRQTYLASGFLKPGPQWGEKQYEIWGVPNLVLGENIIYFGRDTDIFRETARNNFKTVALIEGLRFNLIEDYIANNYKFFRLEGYLGPPAHP